jgi:thiol-disulfide isomerase/thioredoxin
MTKRVFPLTAALLVATAAASAQTSTGAAPSKPAPTAQPATTATLKVGDKAPPLTIAEWVKGDPITGFEKGKIYIVEFWATWCGPCIQGMPHLSDLQRQYKSKGVTVIGVTSQDQRNSLDQVKAMTEEKGDTMGYTVAWDTERKTNEAYMKAANRNGIPCSFLVDQNGTVAYIGHPMWLDKPVADVVAGTWDAKAGAETIQKAESSFFSIMRQAGTDGPGTVKALAEWESTYPWATDAVAKMKFSALMQAGEFDAAYASGAKIVDHAIETRNSETLNEIAWTIVDPDADIAKKDLDLALRAATKGCEFTDWKNAAILDTLARVYFVKGDVKKAVEIQTKAVEHSPAQMKPSLQQVLDEYTKALPEQGG